MKHLAYAVIFLLALLAVASPAVAQDARSLPAPSADKAQIVFIKPMGGPWGSFDTGIFELKDGDRAVLGVLDGSSKLAVEVSPGEHRFMAFTGFVAHFLDAKFDAGKRYYVMARFIYGAGFQLRPIRRTGPSDFNATAPDFAHWLSDTKISVADAKRAAWFESKKKRIDKAQANAQKLWDGKTPEQRLELTLSPDDSLE